MSAIVCPLCGDLRVKVLEHKQSHMVISCVFCGKCYLVDNIEMKEKILFPMAGPVAVSMPKKIVVVRSPKPPRWIPL